MPSSNIILSVLLFCVMAILLFIQPLVSVIDPIVNLPDPGCCPECGHDSACEDNQTLCPCGSQMALNSAALTDIRLSPLEALTFQPGDILSTQLSIDSIFHPPPVI